jgi:hypothetical protein
MRTSISIHKDGTSKTRTHSKHQKTGQQGGKNSTTRNFNQHLKGWLEKTLRVSGSRRLERVSPRWL